MYQAGLFRARWQGTLRDLANAVSAIQKAHLFGRLSLRNTERLSIAHLYFRSGKLVHIIGNRGDAREILLELREWTQGSVRFDRSSNTTIVSLNAEHELLLQQVIDYLHQRGLVNLPEESDVVEQNVIESNVVVMEEAKQLLSPWEWQLLIEGTRRISFAVAHLVGPQEALQVLQDILDDCASAFPAFASLEIAPTGYLHIADRNQFDRLPREELFEGFTALFAICEYFCSPIIGEQDAHQLMIRTLREIAPMLTQLGIFQLDRQLP